MVETNIIIFIIFLAGVATWILWINKELKKDLEEEEQHDKGME